MMLGYALLVVLGVIVVSWVLADWQTRRQKAREAARFQQRYLAAVKRAELTANLRAQQAKLGDVLAKGRTASWVIPQSSIEDGEPSCGEVSYPQDVPHVRS